MYNKFMNRKELEVKVGDTVMVQGNIGTVIEVIKGYKKEWNGVEYVKEEGTDFTNVRVHFIDELAAWGQYQDGVYGGFEVVYKTDKMNVLEMIEEYGEAWADEMINEGYFG